VLCTQLADSLPKELRDKIFEYTTRETALIYLSMPSKNLITYEPKIENAAKALA
jgi:hypothetical protein